jgi:uncharacterized protein with GYD domain
MAIYIILGTFDKEGAVQLLKSEIDAGLARTMAEEADGRLVDLWFTTGPHDFVAVLDMNETHNALSFAVAFGAVARAATVTMAAASPEDVLDGPSGATGARDSHTRHESQAHTRHESRAHTRHEARG